MCRICDAETEVSRAEKQVAQFFDAVGRLVNVKHDLMCRWVGEKPTRWYPIKGFRDAGTAERELEVSRRYAARSKVEVEYYVRTNDG